jgi:hypothetical protein
MRRPSFRLRTLLIAVVIAGLCLWWLRTRQLSRQYLARAALHAREESEWSMMARGLRIAEVIGAEKLKEIEEKRYPPNQFRDPSDAAEYLRRVTKMAEIGRRERESAEARASYHAGLKRKYEEAARYPWLPVDPDPPEPK